MYHRLFYEINDRLGLKMDKVVFSGFARGLGFATPDFLGIYRNGEFVPAGDSKPIPLNEALSGLSGRLFVKRRTGTGGAGAFVLSLESGTLQVNGNKKSIEEVEALFKSFKYQDAIVERVVRQHRDLASFNPGSVNTLRVLTVFSGLRSRVAASTFRMATGTAVVDNAAAGGVFVNLDLESGRLGPVGWSKKGRRYDRHPDSGTVFAGYQLPFWQETLDQCARLHTLIGRSRYTIGWDMAINEHGPLFIEQNPYWDPSLFRRFDPDFIYRMIATLLDDAMKRRYWTLLSGKQQGG